MKKRIILIFCLAAIAALSYYFLSRKKENTLLQETASNKSSSTVYTALSPTSIFFTDMEDPEAAQWRGKKNSEKSLSGKYSNKLSEDTEFGMTFFKTVGDLPNYNRIRQIKISFNVYADSPIRQASIVYAVSDILKDTLCEYRNTSMNANAHHWTKQEIVIKVNAEVWQPDWQIKIYPWNPAKETFFVDDIKIEFFSEEAQAYGKRSLPKLNFFYDFETKDSTFQKDAITDDVAHSGKHSLLISSYSSSAPFIKKFGEVATDSIDFISTSLWIYPKNNNPTLEFIASIETPEGHIIATSNKETKNMILEKKEWHKINFRADFRGWKANPEDIIKIKINNKGFGSVYVDDFQITYGDLPHATGGQPGIVADLTGNIIMRQGKNKPPFRQEYFWESEENNLNLVAGIKNGGTLEPGSKMIAGNFLNAGDYQDDLLMVMDNQWSIFRWCQSEKNLVRIVNAVNGPDAGRKITLKGFFSNTSWQDVIVIDTAREKDAQLVHFNAGGDPCTGIHSKESILETREVKFEEPDFIHAPVEIYSGDFIGNSYSELLFINRETGAWHVYNFDQVHTGFVVKGSGNLPEGEFISGLQFNTDGNHDKLVVFCERNHQMDYYLYDFTNATVKTFEDKSFLQNFGYRSEIFSMETAQHKELFYFNNDWRLDIKKIKLDATGFNVESQMEFYRNDTLNPKFFEYVQVIPGNFFNHQTELLVLARNCKDKSFDGKNCNEFEKAEGLPPGFMFYRFVPVK